MLTTGSIPQATEGHNPPVSADRAEILRALQAILQPGQVTELRAIDAVTRTWRNPHTVSGYFDYDHLDALAKEAANLDAPAIYFLPNPVDPALLARAANRLRDIRGKEPLTADHDVIARRWLLVDADARRPAGISSTDAEHAAALARATEIADWLSLAGWPEPIHADSGNGGHLMYLIDLPAADGDLVQRALQALAFRFDDKTVNVDQTTFNPARIWKLYGSVAGKGDSIPERPHRIARLLHVSDTLTPVPRELLETLAAMLPKEPELDHKPSTGGAFDLDRWIAEHLPDAEGPSEWTNGRRWILPVCPWNPDHANRAAFILQFPSGAIAAGCHHNGCTGHDWHALRDLVEPGWRDRRNGDTPHPTITVARTSTAGGNGATIPALSGFTLSDTGNAERLVAKYGADLHYVYAWGRWLAWDSQRWAVDDSGQVDRLAKDTVRAIYAEAAAELDDKQRGKIAEHAKRSESERARRAMVSLAQAEPEIPIRPADLDANPWLLTVLNGTVDLRTGLLLSYSRSHRITKMAGTEYRAGATCPTWDSFLRRIMGENENLIAFLRRAVGYALTGDTSEQCLFMLYGLGANGKSTFLETIRALLGEYGQQADFSTFLQHDRDGVRNDIARMIGARMVSAIEAGEGRRLAEVLVKQLTGQDTVTARYLFHEFFEFRPAFKLFLAVNHKPVIRETTRAIWRRVKLIPFTVTIPEDEQDKKLPDKLKAELPGILNWALQGCLDWQRNGLGVPDEVRQATEEYRNEMDVIGGFLADCCIVQKTATATAKDLYAAYKGWCEQNDERPMSQKALSMRLSERGFEPHPGSGGRREWWGLGVLAAGVQGDLSDDSGTCGGCGGFSQEKPAARSSRGGDCSKPPQPPQVPQPDTSTSTADDSGATLGATGKAHIDRTRLQELIDAGVPMAEAKERARTDHAEDLEASGDPSDEPETSASLDAASLSDAEVTAELRERAFTEQELEHMARDSKRELLAALVRGEICPG